MSGPMVLATVQALVEGVVFFVPLAFFLVILVRGSRAKPDDRDADQPEG